MAIIEQYFHISGHYLYIEASSPAEEGDKAALVSKVFEDRETRCLNFYYHMHGTSVGALRVYMELASSGQRKLLWERIGNQTNSWEYARVTLKSEENYKV